MISTIIFDFAGVVSTEQLGGWKKISAKFNLDPEATKKRYYEHVEEFGRGGADSTDKFREAVRGNVSIDPKEFEALYVNWWKIDENIVTLAKQLREKYRVVLFSDNFDASTPSMRADERLGDIFEKMYFSNEIGHTKKEKESFQFVLVDLGVKSEECLFIDDKEGPIATSESLGIQSILFKGEQLLRAELVRSGIISS